MDESRSSTGRYAGRHRTPHHGAPDVPGLDVGEALGHGGSGSVWSATDARGEQVAVKVVPACDAEAALVELAVLRRMEDPHLVRMHDALALPGGGVAIVLDLLPGGSLGSAVRARGHLSPGETVTALSPIASVLGRLHGVGVVHGDVSPGNVLLDLGGRPFLADLGVARVVGGGTEEVRGTEGFVAPEVLLGATPVAASDVFGLGALAWFCLTGAVPDPAGIRRRLPDLVPELPEALVDAVESALRTRPEERPDADTLAMALYEAAEPRPLELVRGEDDVSLLTRRIREAARAAVGEPPAAPAGSARRRVRRPFGPVRPSWTRPSWTRPSLSSGRAGAALRWLGAAVAVLLTVATVGAGSAAWSGAQERSRSGTEAASDRADPSASRDGKTGTPGAGGGTSGSGPTGASANPAAAPDDIRLAADAPRRDPVALVRALADARARAWSTGVAPALVEVDAPRSPALARDTEVLAGVQRAGQRYVGLRFEVRDAEVVGERDGVVTLRTRIDTGAHTVRSATGEQQRPAAAGDPVLLDVVRTGSGWRVHDVRAVTS